MLKKDSNTVWLLLFTRPEITVIRRKFSDDSKKNNRDETGHSLC